MRSFLFVFALMLHACGCGGIAFAATDSQDYELVAKSQTDQVLGPKGGAGDVIVLLVVTPETTAPGLVAIQDGSGTAVNVYTGGTVSAELQPIIIPLGAKSTGGAWSVTTGDNVHVVAVGKFK